MKTFLARLLPDSIVGRTVLALVAGLLVSHAVLLSLYTGNRLETILALSGRAASERLAQVAEAARDAASRDEMRAARILGGPEMRLAWTARPLVAVESDTRFARVVRERLARRLGEGTDVRVAVTGGGGAERPFPDEGPGAGPGPGPMMGGMQGRGWFGRNMHEAMHGAPDRVALWVSVGFGGGRWLNLSLPLEGGESLWAPRFGFSFLVLTVLALALSVWAVRRATGPLKAFAAAARNLSADAHAPPLAQTGPREVRDASQAFNDMQARIRRFIEDRTYMVAAISHDLRTPITRLRLRAELMEDGPARAKMLADLEEMEAMVSATLAFARDDAQAPQRAPVDLARLLRELVAEGAARGQEASYAGPESRVISGDALVLKRAFANLLDNAWRYGGAGRVTLIEREGRPRSCVAWDAHDIEVTVDDDGPGVPESERENVFRPFYRLEGSRSRATGGTGLGLALARSAILAHGGTIALADLPSPAEAGFAKAGRAQGGLRVSVSLPAR